MEVKVLPTVSAFHARSSGACSPRQPRRATRAVTTQCSATATLDCLRPRALRRCGGPAPHTRNPGAFRLRPAPRQAYRSDRQPSRPCRGPTGTASVGIGARLEVPFGRLIAPRPIVIGRWLRMVTAKRPYLMALERPVARPEERLAFSLSGVR